MYVSTRVKRSQPICHRLLSYTLLVGPSALNLLSTHRVQDGLLSDGSRSLENMHIRGAATGGQCAAILRDESDDFAPLVHHNTHLFDSLTIESVPYATPQE